MNEREVAGKNYLILFFNEIQLLNHNFSMYINYVLELSEKYSNEIEKIPQNQKEYLASLSQQVRHNCNKTFIQYKSIYKAAKIEEDKELEKLYTMIVNNYIIKRENLRKYVTIINAALVNDVIKDLLAMSETDLYGALNETKATN